MKLTNKIHLYTSAVFIALLLFIVIAIYALFSKLLYEGELEQAELDASQMVAAMNNLEGDSNQEALLRAFVPADGMIRLVHQEDGVILSVTSETMLNQLNTSFRAGESVEKISFDDSTYAFVSIPIIWTDGRVVSLQWLESLERTEETLSVLRFVLLTAAILAIIPVILSGRILGRVITRPIHQLIKTMADIRKSGQFKRIEPKQKSKDELFEMAETFNDMITQLEVNYEKQEQFVSNASHELKTPLTVIESYSSLLKRRGREDASLFDEAVEAIHSESERMRELVQQLLLLAKREEHEKIVMAKADVTQLIKQTATTFGQAYGRRVDVHSEVDIIMETDANKLKQLVYIFLDNAKKYSEGAIYLKLAVEQQKVVISIQDEGIGIKKEHLSRVFDRFYQVEPARTGGSGYGLGLSLANELAKALGAELFLESEFGKGTIAKISLPVSQ